MASNRRSDFARVARGHAVAGGRARTAAVRDDLGTQYSDAFRQQNIVAIAHPTMPFPAPLLPTEGDALPPTFEVGGRQYPDTAILRNALPGPAFRAPALSIPAGLTRDASLSCHGVDGLHGVGRLALNAIHRRYRRMFKEVMK